MLIRCTMVADGPGPSEAVVGIRTVGGHDEEVALSRRQIADGAVEVGAPLLIEGDKILIELPREAVSGRWRIWVPRSEIAEPALAAE